MGQTLRLAGILLFLLLFLFWLTGGARVGFTLTSVAEERVDETTGLTYPEYHERLVPGVEFLALGLLALAGCFAAAALADWRARASAARHSRNSLQSNDS